HTSHFCSRSNLDAPLALSFNGRSPRLQMHTVSPVKIRPNHGPMKCNKTSQIAEPRRKACDIAIAHKDLWMGSNHLYIDLRQQIVRAISAAHADDCLNIVSTEHFLKFTRPSIR